MKIRILEIVWAIFILTFTALSLYGVITDHVLYVKLSMVLGGFLFYTFLMMSLNKDEDDESGKTFNLIGYADKSWDNWILNWIGAILLLLAGQQIFGIINLMEETDLKWTDGYYAASGFIVNLIVDRWKAYLKKKKLEGK